MKLRLISIILAVITLLSVIPVFAEEEEAPKTVFTAYEIYYDAQISSVTTTAFEISEHDGIPYASVKAAPGEYGNYDFVITLKSGALNFNVFDYPIIGIGYRTNAQTPGVDVSMIYDGTETWNPKGTRAGIKADEKSNLFTYNVLDMNAKVDLTPDYKAIDVRLKPWGGHEQNIATNQYFDIAYIAFFPTVEEAQAFKFVPMTEEEYFEKNSGERVEKTIADADENTILEYISKEEALKYEILNSPNTVFPQAKKTYYVSPDGDDANDGRTPETAWKTLDKVNNSKFGKDDVVRFKRGGIWRGNLAPVAGAIYSSYGEGAKPAIYGSIEADGKDNWIATVAPNIWRYANKLEEGDHPGNIVFDGGRAWGIYVFTNNGARTASGSAFNGIESFDCPEYAYTGYADLLKNNLEFWYDPTTKDLYIYCDYGNPGEYFKDIELSRYSHIVKGKSNNIIIDNLSFMYGGYHGISLINANDYKVQYCTFGWIGGPGIGNAIESWDNANKFTIDHCYAYQVYDCAWTAQSKIAGQSLTIKNLVFTNNVSEFCNTGVEIWFEKDPTTVQTGTIKNVTAENNYTMYGGYGFSNYRPSKDGNFVYGGTSQNDVLTHENVNFNNNVNIHATTYGLYSRFLGPNSFHFDNNVYMMQRGKAAAFAASNLKTGMGMLMRYGYDNEGVSLLASYGNDVNSDYYYLPDDFTPHTNTKLQDFTDIYGHWGIENISFAVQKGLFSGTTDTTFTPNGKMTRAMLVTVLSRLAGDADANAKSTYTDVAENAWFASAVAWAETKGIADKGGEFRPDDNATREEMADMLYRFAKAYGMDTSKSAELTFKDAAAITYKDAVSYCVGTGIIAGYGDNTVKPAGEATRAEVATMLKRFIML